MFYFWWSMNIVRCSFSSINKSIKLYLKRPLYDAKSCILILKTCISIQLQKEMIILHDEGNSKWSGNVQFRKSTNALSVFTVLFGTTRVQKAILHHLNDARLLAHIFWDAQWITPTVSQLRNLQKNSLSSCETLRCVCTLIYTALVWF